MTSLHEPTGAPLTDSVALVMPAHRGGPDLAASVQSILALDPPPDEFVIVVDGGDPDVSRGLDPSITVVNVAHGGPGAARNAGVRSSQGDIVLFIDSDIVVPSDLVGAVRAALAADGAEMDAIIGSYDDRPAATTTVSQFRNLLHHWTHQQAAGPGHTFWGACGAIRRSAFEAVGGFDERYTDATIEDIELGERLTAAGHRIDVVPSIQVTHLKRWTLTSMIHTDITKRGVPWTRLMLAESSMSDDLNTTRRARITVAATGAMAAMAMASLAVASVRRPAAILAAVLAAVVSWRDRRFLTFLADRRSVAFAVRSAPLMWVHHLCAGIAFAWAVGTWPWHRRRDAARRDAEARG
ncbi:MAG: glycosyltransferase [Ilumatobacter sp.]|uniref:glycosyltransferase family 2 protein n=1 Tax=Ilumatobacter sp. TaxID=1967498 RepID=UPI003C750D37